MAGGGEGWGWEGEGDGSVRGGHGRKRGRGGRGGRGWGRDGGIRQHGGGNTFCLSDEELRTLSGSIDSNEVLASVNDNEAKFLNTYKNQRYCNHPLKLKQLIKLLHLLTSCEDQRAASMMLAQILSASGEYASFMMKIDQLLKNMALETRDHIRRENPRYISYLVDIGLVAINTVPTTVFSTYPVTVMEETIRELTEMGERMQVVMAKFDNLKSAFKLARSAAIKERMSKNKEKHSNTAEPEPPEPFTELPILPTLEEMHSSKVFLRSNKIKGAYKSWQHYFDVQFRLLREDFIQPLRKGISVYCDSGSTLRTADIHIYENAKILNPVCLFTGMGFQLRFDSTKLKHINWEHSRRLIFGSLLCLSNDDFDKCMFFATVVKRDPKTLKDGLLTIKFENDVNGFQIDPTESFKMVESTAYFEAYRHVLEGLQEMSRFPDVLPMKSYIVDCQLCNVETPAFLNIPQRPPIFDMSDILKKSGEKRRRAMPHFDVTKSSNWPSVDKTGLDESQLRALKMALSQEVSVIQGPPGTGKTFIGLKIVEAYLKNRTVWDPEKASPILVVCYTNHALDQFLEIIHEIPINDEPPNIIRVGGRCKSEVLAECILSTKVRDCRASRQLPHRLHRDVSTTRTVMNNDQESIDQVMKMCDAESKNNIIGLSYLVQVMDPLHYEQLKYGATSEAKKEVEIWLGLWYSESEQDSNFMGLAADDPEPFPDKVLAANLEDEDGEDEAELIEVDAEARVLEEGRMIEGEVVELSRKTVTPEPNAQQSQKSRRSNAKTQDGWTTVQLSGAKRKKLINQGFKNKPMTKEEAAQVRNLWRLNSKQKWQLYMYWMNEYTKHCKDRVNQRAAAYNEACKAHSECQRDVDSFVARGADIVGMTTTGAAKYHHVLKNLHPKIVIFEEAAEVLEAHIITSLAPSVQQLIMIGDHKQLRPKPTCYDLEKDHNLAVSLFERLADNDFSYASLEIQHRMRPEISRLIHPSIYDHLIDADVVKKYKHVKGVSKDVFFINHSHPEEKNQFRDMLSKVNLFEAEYTVELCHYLLKQGYPPDEITILTMYRGQLFELRKRMKREDFEGVRVAAVDDFQGEENEIILLSLVRSNSDDKIGFLKVENRVCVALSRAKMGLYVIGNLAMLTNKFDTKWPEILQGLQKQNCIGNGLPLHCVVHPDDKSVASKPEDFRKRPEGGCSKICGTRLECGHACHRICHPKDREHLYHTCTKVCMKPLRCGHNCKGKCYQCKKNGMCVPCSQNVSKILACGHPVTVRCSADLEAIVCSILCEEMLPCGHQCQNKCSQPCSIHCKVGVKKLLPCGHTVMVPCFKDPSLVVCTMKCGQILECGDKCVGTCGKCQQGRLHMKCKQQCGRDLVCGHPCDFPCASICPPCLKPCNNYCIHSQCPKKCFEPCTPCLEKCEWRCPHFKCTKPCGQPCNRPPCNKPCKKVLKCGHECIGLCGERCPSKCRVCNRDEVCEIFFGSEDEDDARFIELRDCNHIFEVSGLDQWMRTDTSGSQSDPDMPPESNQVLFKVCPRCKTPIRKSLRYGDIIKEVLKDVNAIKYKQIEASSNLSSKWQEMKAEIKDLNDTSFIRAELLAIKKEKEQKSSSTNSFRAATLEVQLTILPKIQKLKILDANLKPLYGKLNISGCSPEYIQEELEVLKKFLMQEFLSAQEISDCLCELRRLTCSAKLLELLSKIREKQIKILSNDLKTITENIKEVHYCGWKNAKMSEEQEEGVTRLIREMIIKYRMDALTVEERIKIVSVIGLSKGHWYKCPNGHYYCIGECGGATQRSRCPDCGSTIGGEGHRLAEGNRHAGEMDSSQYAAWSDAANIANLDPAQMARLRI